MIGRESAFGILSVLSLSQILLAPHNSLVGAFSIAFSRTSTQRKFASSILPGPKSTCDALSSATELYSFPGQGEDNFDDEEMSSGDGSSLASDFFQTLQNRNIELSEDDLMYDDDDEEDDYDDMIDEEDEEESFNLPQGAINAFTGYDAGGVGKLEGNVTLTNEQVYSELKERALESAGSFLSMVGGADENEDEVVDDQPKVYKPPELVPDPSLTAGEVVTTVLEALNHNDVPVPNRGIVVLFGYSSSGSAIAQAIEHEGMSAAEYAEFLKDENEYKVLFDHSEVIIDKGDYSFDKKKAFFTARLRVGDGPLDFTSVNFILSTQGQEEDDCWLIDSLLIRPEGMRRRRRR